LSDKHALLAHHFHSLPQQRETQAMGMWIFLATEALVFGAMFTGYTAYRTYYPAAFEAASEHLNVLIGTINTIVLLTSSLTMALAVHAAQVGRKRMLLWCMALTALLGATFMVFKGIEYYQDYRENLIPGLAFDAAEWSARGIEAGQVELFLSFYYVMTLVHALHLTVGIGLVAILAGLAWRDHFPPENYMPIELMGLYWHFVDVIWIFLLPLLYLVGTRAHIT
jgi:cytochrome c oxidase subunit III